MKLKYWMRLIRIQNLMILAFIFLVFKYVFLNNLGISYSLSNFYYGIFILSVILIAAGGNIINDIHDKKADRINRPGKNPIGVEISEKTARYTYWSLSLIGLGLGYFLGYVVGMMSIGSIHLIAFFLLWMYSTDFKHRLLFGNLIIAFLAAMVILMIPVFDFIPANKGGIHNFKSLFSIYAAYGLFSFLSTLIREIIKDQEDREGDLRVGSHTFATQYSLNTNKNLLFILILILLFGISIVVWYFHEYRYLWLYVVLFLVLPTIYLVYTMFKASERKDWARCSTLMKGIMLAGISSIIVFTYLA